MAATLTAASELTYLSFPIDKSRTEETPDGDLLVYGKATDGSVDSDEQIVDTGFSSKAIADWLDTGANVRVQHNAQRDPAGIGVKVDTGPDGETWVKSLIVEPVAKELVRKGALRAYSVGIARPKIVRDAVARGGRIVDGQIVEISLVDRPANKNCGIQLVKSAADGTPEWVGKAFGTDVLAKSVDAPKSSVFSPADLAKLLEHRRVAEERAEKRDMDPNVGGGVDRDKIPAEDFAGENRSFPIVTPGDVSDAASSLGRARGQDTDKIKRRIISIAQRKGPSFVAELPDAWKDGGGDDAQKMAAKIIAEAIAEALSKAKKSKKGKKGKPFAGAAPAFDGQDSDHDGVYADEPGSEEDDDTKTPPKVKPGSSKKAAASNDEEEAVAEPDVEKAGAKKCPECGANYHADSKLKRCEKCGAKLPVANKAADPDDDGDDDDDTPLPSAHSKPADTDADDDADDDDDMGKASKPTPGAGVVGEGAANIQPVPGHREPDGTAIEDFEHDAHLPTVPDASVKTAMRLKTIGAPYEMGALHDMLCPGYHPADVAKCYPGQRLAELDVSTWQAKALDAAVGAPLADAAKATTMWQHAVTIKGTEPDVLDEIRVEAHKSFVDANPGPGTFPTPTELSATSYRRAYISAGHANPGTSYNGPNTHSIPATGGISASDYTRGYLDAGRSADSPSNKGTTTPPPVPAPVPTGEMSRVYYRNSQRDTAKSAMQAMHDHIAQTFPDLCPMHSDNGGSSAIPAVPTPVGASKTAKKGKKAAKVDKAAKVGAPVQPDVVKSAVEAATAPLLEKLEMITKAFAESQAKMAVLQETVDSLSDLPDPKTAPFKGVALNPRASVAKSAGYPAGAQTVAEIAERTQLAMMTALQDQARNDPDPAQREAAWAQLYQMNGLTPTR